MSELASTDSSVLTKRTQYKRLMYGSLLVGILGFSLGVFFDQYIAGVIVYWAGFFGMLGIWVWSPVSLFDERDMSLSRQASDYTLSLFAIILVLGAPAGRVLEQAGYASLPGLFHGAVWTLVAVYAVFGVLYIGLRLRM